MFDLLTIMEGRGEYTFNGKYYPRLPAFSAKIASSGLSEISEPADLAYEYVNPTEWGYQNLIRNLTERDTASAIIRTRDAEDYAVGAYLALNDGNLYKILSISTDWQAANKSASLILPVPPSLSYVIRCISVDDPAGIAR